MAVFGIGAMWENHRDVTPEFIDENKAEIGWTEREAPSLYRLLRTIVDGDIVYIKSFSPKAGLRIKAVGIVDEVMSSVLSCVEKDNAVEKKPQSRIAVNWIWREQDEERCVLGKIKDKYNVRANTLYQEFNPSIIHKVVSLLLNN